MVRAANYPGKGHDGPIGFARDLLSQRSNIENIVYDLEHQNKAYLHTILA